MTTRLGWCPGGESIADTLARYPNTQAVRVFRNSSQTLPSWTGTVLGPLVQAGVLIHLSFKLWDVPALVKWLDDMPATVRLVLTYHHEPEQQDGGDPTPSVFRSRWAQMCNTLATHSARSRILLCPVYTHYWWEHNANPDATWWPAEVASMIDCVGWDIYNESSSSYRAPADMLTLIRNFSAQVNKPYLIGEWGAERVTGDTATGAGCLAWMQEFVNQVTADGALTATWFHVGGDDLVATGRTQEEQKLRELIAGAAVTPPAPTGVTFVADARTLNAAAGALCTVSRPAGVADGNQLVALYGYMGAATTFDAEPPLTRLGTQVDGTNLSSFAYARKAATEPPTYTWDLVSGRKNAGWIGAYKGLDATTPIAAFASKASTTDGTVHTAPTVAVPEGGWLITMVLTRHTNTGTATTWTCSDTSDVERWDAASNAAGSQDITVAVYDSGRPLPAGNYARTLTASQTQTEVVLWSIALAPAPSSSGPAGLVPGVPL
ncbi:hypothetical protein [Micromonospora maritima]|uniref:hypothetical protein n=1 Tax=Micromonospora maritima TaxID=986711 RepID=UPI00157DF0B7|nr:hypothetical protein [Micromonospora maritima]